MSNAASTHRDLWGGIDLKVASASYHLNRMEKTLERSELSGHYAVLAAAPGAIIGGMWHEAFYAHLDAFLSVARSVPELIRCCFGIDGHKEMREWFRKLDADEQARRHEFGHKFKADYDAFRALPLGTARHISEHRTGAAPVTVTVTGLFGLTYTGSPTNPIPTSEAPEMRAERKQRLSVIYCITFPTKISKVPAAVH